MMYSVQGMLRRLGCVKCSILSSNAVDAMLLIKSMIYIASVVCFVRTATTDVNRCVLS